MFGLHDFMGDFCEMAEISTIFGCPKQFQTFKIWTCYIFFQSVDLGISNQSFQSQKTQDSVSQILRH